MCGGGSGRASTSVCKVVGAKFDSPCDRNYFQLPWSHLFSKIICIPFLPNDNLVIFTKCFSLPH